LSVLKYLLESKRSVQALIVIVCFLAVQAVCDLALPNYTSNIVDIGIMQGGIENAAPDEIRARSLEDLELFMPEADIRVVRDAYSESEDGKTYALKSSASNDESIKKLNEIFEIPMTMLMAGNATGVGAAAGISRDLRRRMYFRTLGFGMRETDHFTAASLITRSTNDIQQIQMALVLIMRIVLFAPIMAIGGIIMVAGTRSGMGWIVVLAVAFLLVVVISLIRITMPKFKMMQTLIDKLNLISREILTGLPVIRAFRRESHETARFEKANDALMKTQLFTNRAMSMMFPFMMLTMNAISVSVVWFGGESIDAGNLQVGDMMAFITYTIMIVMSFMMISMITVFLPRANVAAERVNEVLAMSPSVTDRPTGQLVKREDWNGLVAFNNVSFRFPDAEEDVLTNISFTANPGETTAIIGSTGSGKSTLVNLIPRMFDVTSGSITIDGVDVRDLSQHDLRGLLGVIPQKGVLFSGDIASNIKFADEAGITDEAMEKAAEIAQATEFVEAKDDGFASAISQGGSNVSGGQKQRISIARAVAKDPKIFIFDDSFSALDNMTDKALRKALARSLTGRTIIIVAQRISTIVGADKIIVLDEGEIAGAGTHRELLETCEVYREIAQGQLEGIA
jgi:ATP-binding cassette subfamily B protein